MPPEKAVSSSPSTSFRSSSPPQEASATVTKSIRNNRRRTRGRVATQAAPRSRAGVETAGLARRDVPVRVAGRVAVVAHVDALDIRARRATNVAESATPLVDRAEGDRPRAVRDRPDHLIA